MKIDSIDEKLINLIATEFPLTDAPYADLGQQLGIDTVEVIRRISQLKKNGIVRQIGPVLNSGSLGYQTTLIAMKVPDKRLGKARTYIREHSGISHGFEREHSFNIWCTLSLPYATVMESEITRLGQSTGAETVISLPAKKVFKISTYFDVSGNGQDTTGLDVNDASLRHIELTPADRLFINELQREIPLVPAPFAVLSQESGMDIALFLDKCRVLRKRGIIWRFNASISYNRAGFKANALVCWNVPQDTLDVAGRRLSSFREVSHCYEREPAPLWRYNLFAMIHGRSREQCEQVVDRVCNDTGVMEYELLYSTGELKKTRIHYTV